MKDKTITILVIIVIFAGLIILYLIGRYGKIETTPIESINLIEGKEISVKGEVIEIIPKDKLTIVKVGYETTIDAALFENPKFKKGDQVVVIGRAEKYNGRLEIVAEEIRKG